MLRRDCMTYRDSTGDGRGTSGYRQRCLPANAAPLRCGTPADEVGDQLLSGRIRGGPGRLERPGRLDRLDAGQQAGHRGQLGQLGSTGSATSEMGLELLAVPLFEQSHRIGADIGVVAAHGDTPRSSSATLSARSA
jgi:hypothetical protein